MTGLFWRKIMDVGIFGCNTLAISKDLYFLHKASFSHLSSLFFQWMSGCWNKPPLDEHEEELNVKRRTAEEDNVKDVKTGLKATSHPRTFHGIVQRQTTPVIIRKKELKSKETTFHTSRTVGTLDLTHLTPFPHCMTTSIWTFWYQHCFWEKTNKKRHLKKKYIYKNLFDILPADNLS